MSFNSNESFKIQFNNLPYILSLNANDNYFIIVIESLDNISYWKGEFNKQSIDFLTKKVGQQKEYFTFIKLLITGIKNTINNTENKKVYLDLLDYDHIERIKQKADDSMMMRSSNSNTHIFNKNKYLVLTFDDGFEIKHFPLILEHQQHPETTLLYNTIIRLKSMNNNHIADNIKEVKEENQILKNKITLLESQRTYGAVEIEQIITKYDNIKSEYDSYKNNIEKKVESYISIINDFKLKESQLAENNNTLLQKNTTNEKERLLTEQIDTLTKILFEEREKTSKLNENKNKEIANLNKEISVFKEKEKKLKVKINQLEKELDRANGRNTYIKRVNSETKSIKSNASIKSYNTSKASNFSGYTKNSNKSNSSLVKKNLIPNNQKVPYKSKYLPPNTFNSKTKPLPKTPTASNLNYNNKYKSNSNCSVKSVYSSKSKPKHTKTVGNITPLNKNKPQQNKGTNNLSTFTNLQSRLSNVNSFLQNIK